MEESALSITSEKYRLAASVSFLCDQMEFQIKKKGSTSLPFSQEPAADLCTEALCNIT
jgi:hypothetical protein